MKNKGFGLIWFIFVMVIFYFMWYLSGGPQRYQGNEGPYIKPPPPIGTGQTYGPPL